MKVFANIDHAFKELDDMGRTLSDLPLRVGTGEVIDSLSLDELTLYSRELITFFAKYPKWKLEFKTKSSLVDQFLDVPHAKNVIVSFSVNPQNIVDSEEHGTASLADRIKAARKACDKGFLISFHIDPMIWHPEWRESYSQLIDLVTQTFTPDEVLVMSVGALRFQPEQRHMMRVRFKAQSMVTTAEVFTGYDGKLRYDQKTREEMFQFVLKRFKDRDTRWNLFLCMETPETWLGAANAMPKKIEGLGEFFDHQISRKVRRTTGTQLGKSE